MSCDFICRSGETCGKQVETNKTKCVMHNNILFNGGSTNILKHKSKKRAICCNDDEEDYKCDEKFQTSAEIDKMNELLEQLNSLTILEEKIKQKKNKIDQKVISKAKSIYYYSKKNDEEYVALLLKEYKKNNKECDSLPYHVLHKKTNEEFDEILSEKQKKEYIQKAKKELGF